MSEPACVFRQGSGGSKNCVLTSESMHETLSTTEGLWARRVMATQSYRHPNQPCYSSATERKRSSQHTKKLLFGSSYQGGVCVYWLCAEGKGCTGDWGRQVESLGNLPPQFLVNNLDQTALLSHQPVEWVQIQNLLGHNGNTVHWSSWKNTDVQMEKTCQGRTLIFMQTEQLWRPIT